MGRMRVGIAIGRRAARLSVVSWGGKVPLVLLDHEIARAPGVPPSHAVGELLKSLPDGFRRLAVSVALASGDLACDDLWAAPPGLRGRDVADVAPVLLEARATGETLEDLAVDVRLEGSQLSAVALDANELATLRRTIAENGGRLVLATSLSAALALHVSGAASASLCWAGQRTWVRRQDGTLTWGSSPVENTVEGVESADPLVGVDRNPGAILAFAVGTADHELLPNALRGASDAPRSFSERHRVALRTLGIAAACLLASLGFFFSREEGRLRSELAGVRDRERAVWKHHFPDRLPVPDDLLRTVRERLRDSGQGGASGLGTTPSAFLFWLELGKVLPDVEALGLSLESLDISPEGGRLSASVAAVPGDVLRNAALLEAKVGESARLSARGDFEARERDVQVRLKLDSRGP